jgi:RNA polymerase sigma-70 factor (sigma-E family)
VGHPGESAVERTLGSLRAIDAVAPADASVVHPSARPSGPPRPAAGPGPGQTGGQGGLGGPPGPVATQDQAPRTLEDLYREHRMRFVRLAVLLVDDPATAEDVVQEAFTGLHRHWGRLRDEHAALGYLRTAVVNGSRSVLRRRRTAREYTPPHTADARSAESLAMLSTEHQAVVAALGKLPRRQREVLVLRYYGGLSEAEIAEATGISKGTVKSTASRGLEAIGKLVGDG